MGIQALRFPHYRPRNLGTVVDKHSGVLLQGALCQHDLIATGEKLFIRKALIQARQYRQAPLLSDYVR